MSSLDKALQEFRETVFKAVSQESEPPADFIESSNPRDAYRLAYDRVQESQAGDDKQDDDETGPSVDRSEEAAGTSRSEDYEEVVSDGTERMSEEEMVGRQGEHERSVASSEGGRDQAGSQTAARDSRSDHQDVGRSHSENREREGEGRSAAKKILPLIVIVVVLIVVGIVIVL